MLYKKPKVKQSKSTMELQKKNLDFTMRLRESRRTQKTVMPVLDDIIRKGGKGSNQFTIRIKGFAGELGVLPNIKVTHEEAKLAVECYQKMFGNKDQSGYQVQDARSDGEKRRMYRNFDFQRREQKVCRPLYTYINMADPVQLMNTIASGEKRDAELASFYLRDRLSCQEQHRTLYEIARGDVKNWEEYNELAQSVQDLCPFPKHMVVPSVHPPAKKKERDVYEGNYEGQNEPFLHGEYTWGETMENYSNFPSND